MQKEFNPFQSWLGIAAEDQPLHFYRLLDLPLGEADRNKIRAAVQRQSARVRRHQLGKHAEAAQAVLNEIAAAWATLADPQRKAIYDKTLRDEPVNAIPKPHASSNRSEPAVSNRSAMGYGVAVGAPLGLILVLAVVQPFGRAATAESRLILQWRESERAGATLSVDGRTLPLPATGAVEIRVTPGEHEVSARRPQYTAFEQRLTLIAGQRQELQPQWSPVEARPSSPPRSGTPLVDNAAVLPSPAEPQKSVPLSAMADSPHPTAEQPSSTMAGGNTSPPSPAAAGSRPLAAIEQAQKSLVQISYGYGGIQTGLATDRGFVLTTLPASLTALEANVQFADGSVARTRQIVGIDPARNLLLLQVSVPGSIPGLALAPAIPAEGDPLLAVGGPSVAFPGQPDSPIEFQCSLQQPSGLAGMATEPPIGLLGTGQAAPRWIYCSAAVPVGAALIDSMGRAVGLVVRQQAGWSIAAATAEVPSPGLPVALSDLPSLLASASPARPSGFGASGMPATASVPSSPPVSAAPMQPQGRSSRRRASPLSAGAAYRIALPSDLVLDSQQFEAGRRDAIQAAQTLLANSVYLFDQALDAGSQRLLEARQAQLPLAMVFRHPDNSVRAVVRSAGGKLDGPAVVLHPGQDMTRYSATDVTPFWCANYSEDRIEGSLQSWNADGTKQYYCQYSRDRRQGLSCWFEQDQPRLAMEYSSDRLAMIHLISGAEVSRSFESEEKAKADADVRALLEESLRHAEELKQEEVQLRRQMKDKDRELRDAIASILNQQKRSNMLNRMEQKAEQRRQNMQDVINKSRGR